MLGFRGWVEAVEGRKTKNARSLITTVPAGGVVYRF